LRPAAENEPVSTARMKIRTFSREIIAPLSDFLESYS
jgi:hypothetical protein